VNALPEPGREFDREKSAGEASEPSEAAEPADDPAKLLTTADSRTMQE
jgi:hypothetical protein